MDEATPTFKEKLELRITSRLDAVFEACSRLPEAEKELLFEEIRKRVFQRALPAAPDDLEAPDSTDQAPPTFIDRCRKLADIAPNDRVRSALLMIVRFCEADGA